MKHTCRRCGANVEDGTVHDCDTTAPTVLCPVCKTTRIHPSFSMCTKCANSEHRKQLEQRLSSPLTQSPWDELKSSGNPNYKSGSIEPIDLYKEGGMLRDFALGCIIKYAFRNRAMTGQPLSIKDIEKIIHYAKMLIVMFTETKGEDH